MNKLNSLRSETYEAASKFIQAHEKYFICLSQGSTFHITEAAGKARRAGTVYKATLSNLISYLKKSESTEQVDGELSRAKQLAVILKEELSLIPLPRHNTNILETDHHLIT